MDCMVERFADKLDLTADQREQFTLMAEEAKRKHGEMYSLRMATRAEVMGELRKETIDKAKIDALYDDVKTRFDELYGLFSERFIAFHRSLTPEQKEKLIAQMEKHHRKRNGFHQRWSNEG